MLFKYGKQGAKQKVQLFLIKPSNYDDEGYVVTHFRGVLPSNTLNCLAALTEDVLSQKLLGERVDVTLHLLDETVQTIPVEQICRKVRGSHDRTIVTDSYMMGADFYETREQLEENMRENIPNIGIGENTSIAGAIIDKNARIGNHVSIGNSGECADGDGEIFYVRDHIVVIPGGAIIPDGTIVGKDGK
jgi:hypothetical protein